MRHRWTRASAALALMLWAPRAALACAPAPPPGEHVDVVSEEALVVWDAERRLQHFVRRASFASRRGTGIGFGFLVPTPSRPELAEASDAVFSALDALRRPEVIERRRTVIEPGLSFLLLFHRSLKSVPPVVVLEERRVAGYDAAVLAAQDEKALVAWLGEHGYAVRADLAEWLRPYVQQRWIVTAFKIAADPAGRVATSAVRMSFAAERPFFPYREPAEQRQGSLVERRLLVHVVAPQRMQGLTGDAVRWKADVLYASPRNDLQTLLAAALPAGAAPAAAWLTTLVDVQARRPDAGDVFFAPAPRQDRVVPEPIEVESRNAIPLPLDLLAVLAGVAFWRHRRARG